MSTVVNVSCLSASSVMATCQSVVLLHRLRLLNLSLVMVRVSTMLPVFTVVSSAMVLVVM
jgi:hypothetical protein